MKNLLNYMTCFIARYMLVVILFTTTLTFNNAQGQTATPTYPIKRAESREQWEKDGRQAVEQAKRLRARSGHAKNVILFVGDGMGITTITAARILEGQLRGESGEENSLSFEKLPYLALQYLFTQTLILKRASVEKHMAERMSLSSQMGQPLIYSMALRNKIIYFM